MKKVLLIVSVALLIGAMLVVSCSAANYSFVIPSDLLTSVNPDPNLEFIDFTAGRIAYVFENPVIDYTYSANISKMVVNVADDGIATTEFYILRNGVEEPYMFSSDSDPLVQAGYVDISATAGINYDFAMDVFALVFPDALVDEVSALGPLFKNFSSVISWIPGIFIGLIAIFWTGSALTPLGYLAVAGLSVSVILLIVYLISRFLKFRG